MHISIKIIILKVFTREGNLRSAFHFALPVGILFTRWKKNRAWSYIVDSRERDENPIWYWILFCLTFQQWILQACFLEVFFHEKVAYFPHWFPLIPIDWFHFFFSGGETYTLGSPHSLPSELCLLLIYTLRERGYMWMSLDKLFNISLLISV